MPSLNLHAARIALLGVVLAIALAGDASGASLSPERANHFIQLALKDAKGLRFNGSAKPTRRISCGLYGSHPGVLQICGISFATQRYWMDGKARVWKAEGNWHVAYRFVRWNALRCAPGTSKVRRGWCRRVFVGHASGTAT